jgi:lysophospholipase L1-like esterase
MVELAVATGKYPNIIASDAALRKIRRERAAVQSGERRSRVLVMGDSTNAGRGAGSGDANLENGARAKSPTAYAVRRLQSLGFPARGDAWIGDANVSPATMAHYTEYNPDVVIGANWSSSAFPAALGGGLFQIDSPNTNSLVFTPQKAADRFTLMVIKSGSSGTFTVTDTSGTLATVDTSGSSTFVKQAVTRAVADQAAISMQRSSGGAIFIQGCEAWNSSLAEYCLVNAGAVGATSTDLAKTANLYEPLFALQFLVYDLVYVEVGPNDINTGIAFATFQANLAAIAASVLAVSGPGSLIIGISAPGTAGGVFDLPVAWRNSLADLARTNDAVLVDHYSRFVSREADTGLYTDGIHLKAPGYAMKGDLLATALTL